MRMMERTIKFRGFTKDLEYNVWNYGFLVGDYIVEMVLEKSGLHLMNKVDMKSIGQFTGLRDINHREIYEGDIIQDESENIYLVVYVEVFTSFCLISFPCGSTISYYRDCDNLTKDKVERDKLVVVGNDYEHRFEKKELKNNKK